MADLELTRDIAAAPQRVWAAITDLEGSVDIISGITKVERLSSDSEFEVGTRWRETRTMFGKEATEEMEVSALEPPQSYTVVADSHSVHYTSTWTVEPWGDGTRLAMTFDAEPQGGFAKFMAMTVGRLMKGPTRRALAKDLDEIAKAVES